MQEGTTATDLAVGDLFANRYRILRELGQGGMGVVYAAEDVTLSEGVALKVLHAAHPRDGSLDLFRREVRLARRVTHPNVVRTYDIGLAEGLHFLTMELVEGGSLRERITLAPLPLQDVVRLARQIADGLTAAHEAGVVHRDLKPSNVLVTRTDRVALTDFGIARSLSEGPSELTRSGLLLGTPAYMAPEQLFGDVPGPAADLYAFGLLVYEMATGRRVHPPTSSPRSRLQDEPVDPAPLAHLPASLSRLVLDCLSFEIADRPPGAREVSTRLATLDAEGANLAFRATDPGGPGRALEDDPVTVRERPHIEGRFAPMPATRHAIAVLPFHASEADVVLAEALAEELSDRLCRTDGFLVFGVGATRAVATRDVKRLKAELGADLVLDGTLTRSGGRTRTSVRLFDSSSGAQLWADRFDGELADALEVQDRVANRIAEILRVELELRGLDVRLDAQDVADYLDARGALRGPLDETESLHRAAEVFRRLVERVPCFDLAIAGRADALARLSFAGLDVVRLAEIDEAVDHALRVAPWLPETQLAAARRSVARGEFAEAAGALARATRMAPTFAAAHAYLGSLQVEAGRAEEGTERIELAVRIDPKERWALAAIAKHFGLRRDYARSAAILDALTTADPRYETSCLGVRLRQAIWRDAKEEALELAPAIQRFAAERPMLTTLFDVWMGAAPPERMERLVERLSPQATPRARSLYGQLLTEMNVRTGRLGAALRSVEEVGATILIDLEWLTGCEALDPIRDAIPSAVHAAVKQRAFQIWRV